MAGEDGREVGGHDAHVGRPGSVSGVGVWLQVEEIAWKVSVHIMVLTSWWSMAKVNRVPCERSAVSMLSVVGPLAAPLQWHARWSSLGWEGGS